jgi:hypothetical protein
MPRTITCTALTLALLAVTPDEGRAQAPPKSAEPRPTAVRFVIVMNHGRVVRLAELCRLRPVVWLDDADEMIMQTFVSDLADPLAEDLKLPPGTGKLPTEMGVAGALWGGRVVANGLAEREHKTYGTRACQTLERSSDLEAVDLQVEVFRRQRQRQR